MNHPYNSARVLCVQETTTVAADSGALECKVQKAGWPAVLASALLSVLLLIEGFFAAALPQLAGFEDDGAFHWKG